MVLSKLGIQADHVKSDKCLAKLKPSSSQHQDGKTRGTDKMKKMVKSRSIQLSDFEPPRSPPSARNLSKPRKQRPLQVPTTPASPQQQKNFIRRSPNYMKPTSSSDAKKELFPVSHRITQTSSDGKSLPQKCMRNSKASLVSVKEPVETLSRPCSSNSTRTLTKTPSFNPCNACSSKFTSEVLFEDVNAPESATCSSTLKDSKFPEYLMLHPGGTESEGVSVMKVCPYTYCSLNGHDHAPLPPLKSFMSARKSLLENQKYIQPEAVSPRRWKVPAHDTKKDYDIEQFVFFEEPACDEVDVVNPTITPLAQEIDMDFFFEIYAKEREGADEMGKFNSIIYLEEQDINFANEGNGIAAVEDGIKQVTPSVTCDLLPSQINFEEDFINYFADASTIEADSNGSFHLEQNAEDADENHPPSWFHEETYTGSYCSEVTYDGECKEDIELYESGFQPSDMDSEEEHFREFNQEEDTDPSFCSMEETNSKLESLSETSHDIPEMWLHDIFSSHYVDILVEEAHQEAEEEKSTYVEAQPHLTKSVLEETSESIELVTQETDYSSNSESDQFTSTEEVFQYQTNAEDNNRENEKQVDYKVRCVSMVLDEETVENNGGHNTSERYKIDESCEDRNASLENDDDKISWENQIHSSEVPEESTIIVQEQKLVEENQVKGSKLQCKGGEEKHASKNWQWGTKRKRLVEEDDEMRKINPRKPNFLPLVAEPEPEKVDLKHQMIDERKNAEEWMLDFALREAVTRLAPAGKRKVSLLVEAFETVMSMTKCEASMRNDSPFAHARPIQACS